METIAITPAQAGDAEQILAVQRAAYRLEAVRYDDDGLPPLKQTLDDLLTEYQTHTILAARHSHAIAANAGDPIVGSVRATVVDGTAHIGRLVVEPSLHGRGIGRRLLWAIERAVLPVARYELFTGHRSERNLRLYERAGYRRIRTTVDSDRVTLVFMEKTVRP